MPTQLATWVTHETNKYIKQRAERKKHPKTYRSKQRKDKHDFCFSFICFVWIKCATWNSLRKKIRISDEIYYLLNWRLNKRRLFFSWLAFCKLNNKLFLLLLDIIFRHFDEVSLLWLNYSDFKINVTFWLSDLNKTNTLRLTVCIKSKTIKLIWLSSWFRIRIGLKRAPSLCWCCCCRWWGQSGCF